MRISDGAEAMVSDSVTGRELYSLLSTLLATLAQFSAITDTTTRLLPHLQSQLFQDMFWEACLGLPFPGFVKILLIFCFY